MNLGCEVLGFDRLLLDYTELSRSYTIVEMNVSGRTIRELDTRARNGCSIVARPSIGNRKS